MTINAAVRSPIAQAGTLLACCVFCQSTLFAQSVSPCRYAGQPAFRLADGKVVAIVAPEHGRVVDFRSVGGKNWLWSAPARPRGQYGNWGGDKTWLARSLYGR